MWLKMRTYSQHPSFEFNQKVNLIVKLFLCIDGQIMLTIK